MATISGLLQILNDNCGDVLGNIALNPDDFCREWIPALYGYEPGDRGYAKACIIEFIRQCEGMDLNAEYIRKNWSWQNRDRQKFPDYLPAMLTKGNRIYRAMRELGNLPRYNVE